MNRGPPGLARTHDLESGGRRRLGEAAPRTRAKQRHSSRKAFILTGGTRSSTLPNPCDNRRRHGSSEDATDQSPARSNRPRVQGQFSSGLADRHAVGVGIARRRLSDVDQMGGGAPATSRGPAATSSRRRYAISWVRPTLRRRLYVAIGILGGMKRHAAVARVLLAAAGVGFRVPHRAPPFYRRRMRHCLRPAVAIALLVLLLSAGLVLGRKPLRADRLATYVCPAAGAIVTGPLFAAPSSGPVNSHWRDTSETNARCTALW
jgi:hypothetical protein